MTSPPETDARILPYVLIHQSPLTQTELTRPRNKKFALAGWIGRVSRNSGQPVQGLDVNHPSFHPPAKVSGFLLSRSSRISRKSEGYSSLRAMALSTRSFGKGTLFWSRRSSSLANVHERVSSQPLDGEQFFDVGQCRRTLWNMFTMALFGLRCGASLRERRWRRDSFAEALRCGLWDDR